MLAGHALPPGALHHLRAGRPVGRFNVLRKIPPFSLLRKWVFIDGTIAIGAVTAAIAMFATNMQLSNKEVKEAQQEIKALSDEVDANAKEVQDSAKASGAFICWQGKRQRSAGRDGGANDEPAVCKISKRIVGRAVMRSMDKQRS